MTVSIINKAIKLNNLFQEVKKILESYASNGTIEGKVT